MSTPPQTMLRRSARAAGVRSRFFAQKGVLPTAAKPGAVDSLPPTPPPEVKVEVKDEDQAELLIPQSPSPKRRRTVQAVKIEVEEEKVPLKEEIKEEVKDEEPDDKPLAIPKNFYPIYNQVKLMRSQIIAPVDTVGCAEIPLTLNPDIELEPENYRFQVLVALMLSSQTKDEINFKAMSNMKHYFQQNGFEQGVTIDAIRWVDEKKLDELIYSVGFHTRKAGYIKQAAEILAAHWAGDVPNTVEGLVALPGVGPKMAHLTLQKAWGLTLGIGVDTHLDRLAKMWRWVKNKRTPEHTRVELESWLPRELWGEINPELVGFGQTICLPRGRRCDLCSLAKNKLCSNVDRALLKKVAAMTPEEVRKMNRTLRFDPEPLMRDIEDLA